MTLNTIAVGIISGLVSTFVVFVLVEIWKKMIRPKFEELLYSDIYISGEWSVEATFSKSDKRKRNMTLIQNAHSIIGKLVVTAGSDEGSVYDLEGSFQNLILTLTYVKNATSSRDRGTITLIVKEDGQLLEGVSAYYSTDHDDIKHCVYRCIRNDSTSQA